MSKEYIYFAATLPYLHFEGDLPFTVEEYLAKCEYFLDKKHAIFIKQLLDLSINAPAPTTERFQEIFQSRHNVHNLMAEVRAERTGKDWVEHVRQERYRDVYLSELFHQAAKEENLQDGQRMADRVQWQYYDLLEAGHFNDIVFFAYYGLKLMILEKQNIYNVAEGTTKFEELKKMCMPEVTG